MRKVAAEHCAHDDTHACSVPRFTLRSGSSERSIGCFKEHKLQRVCCCYLLWRNLMSSPIICKTLNKTAQTCHRVPRPWTRRINRSLETPAFREYCLNRRPTFRKHFVEFRNRQCTRQDATATNYCDGLIMSQLVSHREGVY